MSSVTMRAAAGRTLTSLFKVNRLPPARFTSLRNNIEKPITTTFTKTLCTSPSRHGSDSSSDDEDKPETNKPMAEYVRKQTDIALGITKKLLLNQANKRDDSNLVCAPLSLQVVLSFLNSKTKVDRVLAPELVARLFADGSRKGGPRLSCANGLWVDKSVHLEPSLEQAVTAYKAALNRVDFMTEYEEVRTRVNSWAEEKTNGLIKDALPPGSVDSLTRLLFANALYFKGDWDEQFDASHTKEYDFHLLNGKSVKKVPFMTSGEKQYIRAYDGFKVLKLHYRSGKDKRRYSMCLFLPNAKDGLPGLVERLSSKSGFLDDHIPSWSVSVGEFKIPKFKLSFQLEASGVLKELGLLGGLTEEIRTLVGEPLFLTSIYQKAVIEVDEKGTKAAAVTFGRIKAISALRPNRPKRIDFVADHPFMFVIREDATKTVLFIGYVLNPLYG